MDGQSDGAAVGDRFTQLLGVGEGLASDASWAVRRLLEVLAAERPRVVVVGDVHWAESAARCTLEIPKPTDNVFYQVKGLLTLADVLGARPDEGDRRRKSEEIELLRAKGNIAAIAHIGW